MSTDENKAIVRRYVELMNHEDWAEHVGEFAPTATEAEAWYEQHAVFRVAFPNYQFTVDDLIAEGDKVVVRGMARATHKREFPVGEMKGIAPSGRRLEWAEVWILRLVDGKFADGWLLVDGISRLQQLGVLPLPEQLHRDTCGSSVPLALFWLSNLSATLNVGPARTTEQTTCLAGPSDCVCVAIQGATGIVLQPQHDLYLWLGVREAEGGE